LYGNGTAAIRLKLDDDAMHTARHSLTRLCTTTIAFLLPAVLALGGCGSIEVALGLRTRLDKLPVTAVVASLSPGPALAPGHSATLVITATTSDDKSLVTVGPGKGKVLFDSFTFDGTTVSVSAKGVVSLPADPRLSEGTLPHVRVAVVGHPDVIADLDVPVRYDVPYVAAFAGRAGFDGQNGSDGLSGMGGTPGSIDPNNPSAGGNGTDGGNGGDGRDGDNGQPGPAVTVLVALKAGDRPLLQARVASEGKEQFFLIDPTGGSLSVSSNGGHGGAGGRGGSGGMGGSGGSGTPSGSSGRNGFSGLDGHSGMGGRAGVISASVDPAAAPYLDRLHFSNKSGDGAPGKAPDVRIEPVSALW
jgi:hypothetical protein